MTMYKRPSQRVRPNLLNRCGHLMEDSFLHTLLNPGPTVISKFEKRPIYQPETYFRLLKKNNKMIGIPYVQPMLPKPEPPVPWVQSQEPELDVPDRVYLKLRILKNGVVRVKLNCAIATMYEKYYRHAVQPPFKTVLQAYKSHGFSPEFLEKIKKSHERKMVYAKKVPGILAKIFDKEPVKKIKKKKEEKKVEEDEVPEEDVEEDEVPNEDCELDVEPDEEPEEIVEDDYYSEPEA